MGAYPVRLFKEAGAMLSYSSALWPAFWAVILGATVLTVIAVASYAAGLHRRDLRRRPHPALATIPVPRRAADSMAPTAR